MAGLKKKKKEPSTNPNVVLIIFLVFFFLVTIGLGVWVYYEHEEQHKSKTAKYQAEKTRDAAKTMVTHYSMLYQELKLVLGDPIDAEAQKGLDVDREEFAKENFGRFKDAKTKDAD